MIPFEIIRDSSSISVQDIQSYFDPNKLTIKSVADSVYFQQKYNSHPDLRNYAATTSGLVLKYLGNDFGPSYDLLTKYSGYRSKNKLINATSKVVRFIIGGVEYNEQVSRVIFLVFNDVPYDPNENLLIYRIDKNTDNDRLDNLYLYRNGRGYRFNRCIMTYPAHPKEFINPFPCEQWIPFVNIGPFVDLDILGIYLSSSGRVFSYKEPYVSGFVNQQIINDRYLGFDVTGFNGKRYTILTHRAVKLLFDYRSDWYNYNVRHIENELDNRLENLIYVPRPSHKRKE